jgi:hypothetical protein
MILKLVYQPEVMASALEIGFLEGMCPREPISTLVRGKASNA